MPWVWVRLISLLPPGANWDFFSHLGHIWTTRGLTFGNTFAVWVYFGLPGDRHIGTMRGTGALLPVFVRDVVESLSAAVSDFFVASVRPQSHLPFRQNFSLTGEWGHMPNGN